MISDQAVVLAYFQWSTKRQEMPDAILASRFEGCPEKIIEAAICRASKRHLIDWGVTMRSGWLTSKGIDTLEVALGMESVGTELENIQH